MKIWCSLLFIALAVVACKDREEQVAEAANQQKVQLVEDLKLQVKQKPDSASVRMRLVNALDSLGFYAEAISQVDSLILRDSLNNGLWYAKGQLYESNKDTAAAIKSYERALAIYPSLDAQLSLANLMAENRDERALLIAKSLQRLGMGREVDAHAHFISGVYYARAGQAGKALVAFDDCIKNNYTYMEAYMEKGFVYFEQKNFAEATKIFDKAITVNNLYADAYYWKAKTAEAAGNKEDAITNYQRSLGLDKELKEAREALKRLNG